MTEVKFADVVQCSSEDPLYPASNLLNGSSNTDKWVCSVGNKESTIEVELQFAKEIIVAFIDIGNHGSQSVDILVSHSTRSKGVFVSLVPTFNFMTVSESKQGINKTKVQMFNSDEMMKDAKSLSWDRMKFVCHQPHTTKPFGLSLISVKMVRSYGHSYGDRSKLKNIDSNQTKLKDVFDSLRNESSPKLTKPKLSMWLSSPISNGYKSTVTSKVNEVISPVTPKLNGWKSSLNMMEKTKPDQLNQSCEKRTPSRLLSSAAIAQFMEEVDCFLEDISIKELLLEQNVKVSDLRYKMEQQRGFALVKQQKLIFMEVITEKLAKHKIIKKSNGESHQNGRSPLNAINVDDVECKKCHVRRPSSIISIHSEMCKKPATTPKRPQKPGNRNQLCFDLGDSSGDEENDHPRKRKKASTEVASPSVDISPNKSINRSSVSNLFTKKTSVTPKFSSLVVSQIVDGDPVDSVSLTDAGDYSDKNVLDSPVHHAVLKSGIRSSVSRRKSIGSFNRQRTKSSCDELELESITEDYVDTHDKLMEGSPHPMNTDELFTTTVSDKKTSIGLFNSKPTKDVGYDASDVNLISNDGDTLTKITAIPSRYMNKTGKNVTPMVQGSLNSVLQDKTDNKNITDDYDIPEDINTTQECPICFQKIPQSRIGIHASLCDGYNDDVCNEIDFDQVQCPMCQKMMDKDRIEMHVNMCLDYGGM